MFPNKNGIALDIKKLQKISKYLEIKQHIFKQSIDQRSNRKENQSIINWMNSHVRFHFQKQGDQLSISWETLSPSLRQNRMFGHPLKHLGSKCKLHVTLDIGLFSPSVCFKGRVVILPRSKIYPPGKRDPEEGRRWQWRGRASAYGAPGHLIPHQAH